MGRGAYWPRLLRRNAHAEERRNIWIIRRKLTMEEIKITRAAKPVSYTHLTLPTTSSV